MPYNKSDDNENEARFQKWKMNKLCDLRYHRAVCMLAAGIPFDSVAEKLGVSVRSVERWFHDDDFNHDLKIAISVCFKSSVANAAQYINRSIDVLIEIIEDPGVHSKYRLDAIKQLHSFTQSNYKEPQSMLHEHLETLSQFSSVQSLIYKLSPGSNDFSLPSGEMKAKLKEIWERLYTDKPFPEDDDTLREYWNRHRPI